MDNKKKTKKLAVSAMLSALGVVILYLGSVLNVLDLTAVAIVSLFMYFAIEEIGSPYYFWIYGVVGILSLLFLPDKFAAVAFITLGGLYPMLKPPLDKLPKIPSALCKLIYFNVILTALIAASLFVLHVEDEDLGFNILTYILGNFAFITYELALNVIMKAYRSVLRDRLRINSLFK